MLYQKIAGQYKVKELLTNVFLSKRIPHAWLFLGEEGSQNGDMAYQFSQTLLCDAAEKQFCGECDSCKLFRAKNHPDFFPLKPSGKLRQMKKQDVSDFIKFLTLKSYRGGYKIAVIEDADRLSVSSANALLKSLEEPPEKTVLFLLCKNESDLLPTIVSRCLQVDFLPLSDKELFDSLSDKSDLPLEKEVLVKLSKGHIGNLKDGSLQNIIDNRDLVYSIIESWNLNGKIAVIEGAELIVSFLEKEKKKLEKEVTLEVREHKNLSSQAKKELEDKLNANMSGFLKKKLDNILDVFTMFFRDLLILSNSITENYIINIDKKDLLEDSIKKLSMVEQKLKDIEIMRGRLRGNVNQKLAVESLLLGIFDN